MFFLSASANLIVYALVSVFFIVCLQIKGDIKIPELLPVTVDVSSLRSTPQESISYQYAFHQEKQFSDEDKADEFCFVLHTSCYSPPSEYKSSFPAYLGLRAPPIL